jgi:hypothetical protein
MTRMYLHGIHADENPDTLHPNSPASGQPSVHNPYFFLMMAYITFLATFAIANTILTRISFPRAAAAFAFLVLHVVGAIACRPRARCL